MTEDQIKAVAQGLAWSDLSQKKKRGISEDEPLHWKLFEEDARAAIAAYEATAQPVAWSFQLASYISTGGEYMKWSATQLSTSKPCVPEGSIRNLMPLYLIAGE